MLLARTMGHGLVFKPGILTSAVLGLAIYRIDFLVQCLKCGTMTLCSSMLCYLTTQAVRNKGEQKRVLEKEEREDREGDVSMP